jgi:hypothetical protein
VWCLTHRSLSSNSWDDYYAYTWHPSTPAFLPTQALDRDAF